MAGSHHVPLEVDIRASAVCDDAPDGFKVYIEVYTEVYNRYTCIHEPEAPAVDASRERVAGKGSRERRKNYSYRGTSLITKRPPPSTTIGP